MSSLAHGLIVNRIWIGFLVVLLMSGFAAAPEPQQPVTQPEDTQPQVTQPQATQQTLDRRVILVDLQGPIGPATMEFLINSLEKAAARNAELLIIRMDTPGGLDTSTRGIIKAILNSPVPVATFVAPQGARAASAGTYILYASHIAAMSPATNLGAATPVSIIGGMSPGAKDKPGTDKSGDNKSDEDKSSGPVADSGDAMTHKVVNDSAAYIRGLAEKRGRNADWAELAVREAASITAKEALDKGVIDLIAKDVDDLLKQVNGRTVDLSGRERVLNTSSLLVEQLQPDWKNEFLSAITSPTIAYLLLLIGIYGLIFEGYNPGAVLPGVVGAICLLIALYALQMLPVNYAGLALIVLGVILMIAEVVMPSFGSLGIGGVIAMVIGSIILIDTDVPGYQVSRSLIGAIALASSLGLMAIIGVALKARKRPVVAGREQLLGAPGTALSDFEQSGSVFVHSERWNAITRSPIREGQNVIVTGIDGLTLEVKPVDE